MSKHAPNGTDMVNCHAHIFTIKDVPPQLGKSILPAPLHLILQVHWIARPIKWWTDTRNKWKHETWYIKLAQQLYKIKISFSRYWIVALFRILIGIWIGLVFFLDQWPHRILPILETRGICQLWIRTFAQWVSDQSWVFRIGGNFHRYLLLGVLFLLFPSGRNLFLLILKQTNRFVKMLPGKQTTELVKRYLNILRFANYEEQYRVLDRLAKQYPPNTGLVVLPMDMEFMGAGKPPRSYASQMDMLAKIKLKNPNLFPFVFIDPRRMKLEGEAFFKYKVIDKKVVLEDCFVKDYIEQKGFSGFKLYPALGYFPFEDTLLPLWKYAADNGIPLMTHCIRGIIYYRGKKKKEWDRHPVFEQFVGKKGEEKTEPEYEPLFLPQMKPAEVQEIFTHPLNYICLYKKEYLKKVVAGSGDQRIKDLFGYDPATGDIEQELGHLKLCFAHFGGEDEWASFFEKDRQNYGHHLTQYPDKGIDFIKPNGAGSIRGKAEDVWKSADWYSIICSLMLQHPNVYADISYILHGDLEILPLLRQTLRHPVLRTRVLYGTDFFVVRNHKSEKNMLADIQGGLSPADFDQIARINPVSYLT